MLRRAKSRRALCSGFSYWQDLRNNGSRETRLVTHHGQDETLARFHADAAGDDRFCRQLPALPGGAQANRDRRGQFYVYPPFLRRDRALAPDAVSENRIDERGELAFRGGALCLCRGVLVRLSPSLRGNGRAPPLWCGPGDDDFLGLAQRRTPARPTTCRSGPGDDRPGGAGVSRIVGAAPEKFDPDAAGRCGLGHLFAAGKRHARSCKRHGGQFLARRSAGGRPQSLALPVGARGSSGNRLRDSLRGDRLWRWLCALVFGAAGFASHERGDGAIVRPRARGRGRHPLVRRNGYAPLPPRRNRGPRRNRIGGDRTALAPHLLR